MGVRENDARTHVRVARQQGPDLHECGLGRSTPAFFLYRCSVDVCGSPRPRCPGGSGRRGSTRSEAIQVVEVGSTAKTCSIPAVPAILFFASHCVSHHVRSRDPPGYSVRTKTAHDPDRRLVSRDKSRFGKSVGANARLTGPLKSARLSYRISVRRPAAISDARSGRAVGWAFGRRGDHRVSLSK